MIEKGYTIARLIKILAIFTVLILLLGYLIWEAYWYDQVGIGFISWHTHLMPYVYFCVFLIAIERFFKSYIWRNIIMSVFVIAVLLFAVEGALILKNSKETYPDNSFGHYFSYYNSRNASYYHTWPPGVPHYIEKYEYIYKRETNSLGFPDREWNVDKKGKKRVIAFGDSFTEGDGAPQDSTYVAQLSTMLNKDGAVYEIMNAGTCGSDPFFNYVNYQDRLLKYKPDIILQSLSAGDVLTDMATKGGFQRFAHKPEVRFKEAPWWEPIYAISDISRLFFYAMGYNNMLEKGPMSDAQKADCNRQLVDLFIKYDSLANVNGARLYLVIRPNTVDDIVKSEPTYDFGPVMKELKKRTKVATIDLIPKYKGYIKEMGLKPEDLFWPVDGHHNSRGYRVMAELTARSMPGVDTTD